MNRHQSSSFFQYPKSTMPESVCRWSWGGSGGILGHSRPCSCPTRGLSSRSPAGRRNGPRSGPRSAGPQTPRPPAARRHPGSRRGSRRRLGILCSVAHSACPRACRRRRAHSWEWRGRGQQGRRLALILPIPPFLPRRGFSRQAGPPSRGRVESALPPSWWKTQGHPGSCGGEFTEGPFHLDRREGAGLAAGEHAQTQTQPCP